ncbi:anti-sigma factor family protein [Streptomyces pseudovenezuelae]|uniref:anti-sigma factor family protein n=1 Tax=Streptomyces pseudovenezuelae TaxID=67350 RepID=UPI0036E22A46
MTSTTDTAGHPDVAEISDLTEGVLSPSRTADVRRHLDECELCADVHASLEEIRGLLGTLPGPPRMPADVAGRIDAALAAEALLQATAPEAVNAPAPIESGHVSRETSPTADRPAGHARTSSTGPGRKDRSRNGRRKVAVLGAVITVAALGFGSVLLSALDDGKPTDSARGQASASVDTFSASGLEEQVSNLLTHKKSASGGSEAPHTSMGAASIPGSEDPRILVTPEVPPCIQNGIHSSAPPLATKNGVYKGMDAVLVVLRDPSDSTRITAYIVDASCVKNAPTGTAKVLLKRSYAHS